MKQRRRVVRARADALHVGQKDKFLGLERLGDCSRDRVGVDVVSLTGPVRTDRGDDGHEALGDKAMDDGRVYGADIADVAELRIASRRGDEPGVLAGKPDGERPMDVDHADDVAVHLADEHHPGDL